MSSNASEAQKEHSSPVSLKTHPIQLDEWNGSARQYDEYEKKWHFYGTVAEELIRQLPIKEKSRVLELACGTGVCTLKLAKIVRKGKVVALDFSEEMLSVAKGNAAAAQASNIVFVHGNAGDISSILVGQKFDFAVCNSAFWHFPEPEKVLTGLLELLTESGEFAVSVPIWVDGNIKVREAFRVKVRELLLKHGVKPEELKKITSQHFRQRIDLAALFERCGFAAREVSFEFKVSPESRGEWKQISAFSDRGQQDWSFLGLDPATQKAMKEELNEFRKANFPHDSSISKWRIFVAKRLE